MGSDARRLDPEHPAVLSNRRRGCTGQQRRNYQSCDHSASVNAVLARSLDKFYGTPLWN